MNFFMALVFALTLFTQPSYSGTKWRDKQDSDYVIPDGQDELQRLRDKVIGKSNKARGYEFSDSAGSKKGQFKQIFSSFKKYCGKICAAVTLVQSGLIISLLYFKDAEANQVKSEAFNSEKATTSFLRLKKCLNTNEEGESLNIKTFLENSDLSNRFQTQVDFNNKKDDFFSGMFDIAVTSSFSDASLSATYKDSIESFEDFFKLDHLFAASLMQSDQELFYLVLFVDKVLEETSCQK